MAGGGERAGKSKMAEEHLYGRHMWGGPRWDGEEDLLFWLIGPDYEQARPEAEYLIRDLYRIDNILGDPSTPLNGSWVIQTKFPKGKIVTKSGKDPETVAGRAPHGILAVEVGQMEYDTYLRCLGRVAETRGWAFFNGTFEGSVGWYPDVWNEWQGANPTGGVSFSLPTHSNLKIFPGGEDDPEILRLKATFPPEKFAERFLGRPMKPSGIVYSEFNTKTHCRLFTFDAFKEKLAEEMVINPDWGITLWIDPGNAGYWVGWAIVHGDDAYLFDETYVSGLISEQVVEICQNRSLWKYVKRIVMDIAGKQHHGSEAPIETWEKMTGFKVQARKYAVPDEILRVHSSWLVDPLIGRPHFLVSPKCKRFIQEVQTLYKYPTDEMGQPTSNVPIPENNHACSAVAYGLLDAFGHVRGAKRRGILGQDRMAWDD